MDDQTLQNTFTISVVIIVLLNYINMGCAVDMNVVRGVLRKPIAPSIGFISQYAFMPLVSYLVGYLLLSNEPVHFWFGLFAFGISPGGSASNMWTLVLGGNLNLSLAMTFLSTFSALFMIPIWLFTLGTQIMGMGKDSSFKVPYRRISEMLFGMAFFLGIGLLFQRYLPRVARVCRRILAPVSTVMIIFIVIFGTYAYWSLVKKMTFRMIMAAALNVWFGFAIGMALAYTLKFAKADQLAIMVETGVQNTGISIMIIRLALQSPASDLATLLPVAASLMTPIPLTILWIIRKFTGCGGNSLDTLEEKEEEVARINDGDTGGSGFSSCKIVSDSRTSNGHTVLANGDTEKYSRFNEGFNTSSSSTNNSPNDHISNQA